MGRVSEMQLQASEDVNEITLQVKGLQIALMLVLNKALVVNFTVSNFSSFNRQIIQFEFSLT